MRIIKWTFLILLITCFACSTAGDQVAKAVEKKAIEVKAVKKIAGLPPIYESFSDLAPVFQKQTDTVYVINFWATWCKPCVEELPYFETFNQKYLDKKVKVILISLDFKKKLESHLKPFLEKRQLTSEVLVLIDPDANTWINEINPEWSGAIPATLVYKRTKSAFFEAAFESVEELEGVVQPFL